MSLSDRQVSRLTGEREKSAQIRWLEANHVRHWVNAAGKPIVPVSEIERPEAAALADRIEHEIINCSVCKLAGNKKHSIDLPSKDWHSIIAALRGKGKP